MTNAEFFCIVAALILRIDHSGPKANLGRWIGVTMSAVEAVVLIAVGTAAAIAWAVCLETKRRSRPPGVSGDASSLRGCKERGRPEPPSLLAPRTAKGRRKSPFGNTDQDKWRRDFSAPFGASAAIGRARTGRGEPREATVEPPQ